MIFSDDIDVEKLAEVTLAILSLTSHTEVGLTRAWKGMNWDLLDVLYKKGWICDPVGKQKSVIFTDDGKDLASEFLDKKFGK